MKYKAVISDVDGTLVKISDPFNPAPDFSDKIKQTVAKAQGKVHFGIATARSLVHSRHIFKELNLKGPSILQSGSLVVDTQTYKVLWEKKIEKKDYDDVVSILKKLELQYLIDEVKETGISPLNYKYNHPLCLFASPIDDSQYKIIEKEFSHLKNVRIQKVHWDNNSFAVNVTNSEASKQHAVLEAAKLLGIKTEEIIGIGDSYNDFPLLMACGLKVAMENAVEDLKAIADYIAPSVENDGVAEVIERFVLKG